MKTTTLVLLGLLVVGALAAVPSASAHIGVHIDLNGDGDCSDPGETPVSQPFPGGNGHLFVNSGCRAY